MSDFDLDRLGDVWRQQPDPAELEALRRTADSVRRRARWGHAVDTIAAAVVAAVVLVLVLANPKVDTMLVGGAAILIVLGGQLRQRRLRQEELKALSGTSEEMLDQSIARTEATLKRNRFQLVSMLPAFLIGLAVVALVDRGATFDFGNQLITDPWIRSAIFAVAIAALTAMAVHLTYAVRRGREELKRLASLSAAFRKERESTSEE